MAEWVHVYRLRDSLSKYALVISGVESANAAHFLAPPVTCFPNLISSFTGIDFKMKTLLIDGIKVRVQIW